MFGSILSGLAVITLVLFFLAMAGAMFGITLTTVYGDDFIEEISSRIRQRQERGLPKSERLARAKDREAESALQTGRSDHAKHLWREAEEIRRRGNLQDEPL